MNGSVLVVAKPGEAGGGAAAAGGAAGPPPKPARRKNQVAGKDFDHSDFCQLCWDGAVCRGPQATQMISFINLKR